MENNNPINPSGISLLIKLVIWLVIGWLFSLVIFILFIFLWTTIDVAIKNSANNIAFSPLVWLIFLGIWVVSSIFWNFILSVIYNILWQDDYYDIKIMSSSILAVNLLLIVPFLLLYFFCWTILSDIKLLFIVFAFHIFFTTYISISSIDIVKQPNYSLVYIIWNSIWFAIAVMIFFIIFNLSSSIWGEIQKNLLFWPPILAYSIIPFIGTLFEKIYYKFYEVWNDFLYIPSLSEVLVDEEEVDEVNVKIK